MQVFRCLLYHQCICTHACICHRVLLADLQNVYVLTAHVKTGFQLELTEYALPRSSIVQLRLDACHYECCKYQRCVSSSHSGTEIHATA